MTKKKFKPNKTSISRSDIKLNKKTQEIILEGRSSQEISSMFFKLDYKKQSYILKKIGIKQAQIKIDDYGRVVLEDSKLSSSILEYFKDPKNEAQSWLNIYCPSGKGGDLGCGEGGDIGCGNGGDIGCGIDDVGCGDGNNPMCGDGDTGCQDIGCELEDIACNIEDVGCNLEDVNCGDVFCESLPDEFCESSDPDEFCESLPLTQSWK